MLLLPRVCFSTFLRSILLKTLRSTYTGLHPLVKYLAFNQLVNHFYSKYSNIVLILLLVHVLGLKGLYNVCMESLRHMLEKGGMRDTIYW